MAAVGQQSLAGPPDTARLYERHYRRVFSYCLWRLGRHEDAEDAAQTTFLNAHRALGRGTTPTSEASWLLTIAHNVCLARWRSQKARPQEQGAEPEALARVPAPEHDPELATRLNAALARLPEIQRRAFVLREWQGCSYAEIAEALDTTETAVAALVFRARKSLVRALSDERRPSRLVGGLNAGSLLGWLKSLLGGTAAKLAIAGAVVGAVGIAAGVPLVRPQARPAKPAITPAPQIASVGSAESGPASATREHGPVTKGRNVPARKRSGATAPGEPGTSTKTSPPAAGDEGTTTPPADLPPAASAGPEPTPPALLPPVAGPTPVQVSTPPVVNDTVSSVVGTAQQVVSQLPAVLPPALPQAPALPTVTAPKLGP
jgi:RNA polymerase sigma-70 factor, ECF subfamily